MHVNMALVLKFMAELPVQPGRIRAGAHAERPRRRRVPLPPGPDPGLGKIRFHDWRMAYERFAHVPNVARFAEQAEGLSTLLTTAPPGEDQQKDLDFLLTLGELFTLVVLRAADPRAGGSYRAWRTTSSIRSSTSSSATSPPTRSSCTGRRPRPKPSRTGRWGRSASRSSTRTASRASGRRSGGWPAPTGCGPERLPAVGDRLDPASSRPARGKAEAGAPVRLARPLVATGVGLALADASVVTLALPDLIVELDTTVEGVAAVLGVYAAVLAAALIPAERLRRQVGSRFLGAGGFMVFAAAGVGCGLVDSLAGLLFFRGLQALGAAAGLVCGFVFLTTGERGRERLWTSAAVLGAAAGPALGGVLTELFDWRAIFLVQAPVGALSAAAFLGSRGAPLVPESPSPASREASPPVRQRIELGPAVALALVSAALSAVLFLLVLLLVSGWSLSALEAALVVAIVPVAALIGMRIRGDSRLRASAGCALVGAGVLALAFLPSASVAWVVLPEVLAGLGMGARSNIARRPPPSRGDTGADGHSSCHPSRWDHARAPAVGADHRSGAR